MSTVTLGYSSCPNDVFIFDALVTGKVDTHGLAFEPLIEDVEALNLRAFRRDLDVTKLSFHAFGRIRDTHVLLEAGSALGKGCGPLLVARRPLSSNEIRDARIAIPGAFTTAALLLRLFSPRSARFEVMVFDEILDAVSSGRVDAGLIIHESRFTYAEHDLVEIVDLGDWWEEETGLPIPLGGIVADRRLGDERIAQIDSSLRESILFAHANPESVWASIRERAQELDDEVIRKHIDLYVTDFTTALGSEGRRAVDVLLERADEAGIFAR